MSHQTDRFTTDPGDDEVYTIRVSLDSSCSIEEVLEAIASVGNDGVDVRTLRPNADRTVDVDVDALTPTQRETLSYAVHAGYYRLPRDASLATIADRFEVSKSAASQRLRKAEASLAEQVIDGLAIDERPDEAGGRSERNPM